ncbi:MAG: hypothetical protein OXL38_22525 [Gammaproteobacteria bacterium]|nr:hypothetical protein [Gammaproteobacteria bacterium]
MINPSHGYYDRSIHHQLAQTIGPNEPLSWLMDHVRSGEGRARHAHVQFRRDRPTRRRGGIQLYWGDAPVRWSFGCAPTAASNCTPTRPTGA